MPSSELRSTVLQAPPPGGSRPAYTRRNSPAANARRARAQIDELIWPLRAAACANLDAEMGDRLEQVAPMHWCLIVMADCGCAGLEAMAPRLHGSLSPALQRLYASLIFERDPLLARATREWRPLAGTIEEHCTWLQQNTHHADVIQAWLRRCAGGLAGALAVLPARGWPSRGALFAYLTQRPTDRAEHALFYAAQRLAAALELRYRPYAAQLVAIPLTARERDVLRAALDGAADRQIAKALGISIDAIRYYFGRIKQRVPPAGAALKPRELARVLQQLGTL